MSTITGRKVALSLTLGAFVFVLIWLAYVTVAASTIPVDALALPTPTGLAAWLTGNGSDQHMVFLPLAMNSDGGATSTGGPTRTPTPTPTMAVTPSPTQGPNYGIPTPTPYWGPAPTAYGGTLPPYWDTYWYPIIDRKTLSPNANGEFWYDFGPTISRMGCTLSGWTQMYMTDGTRVGALNPISSQYQYDVVAMMNPATCHMELHYVLSLNEPGVLYVANYVISIDYNTREMYTSGGEGIPSHFTESTPLIVYGEPGPQAGMLLSFAFQIYQDPDGSWVSNIIYGLDNDYVNDLEAGVAPPAPTSMPNPFTPGPGSTPTP